MNQPILAPNEIVPLDKISYPKMASYKLDGNRCIVMNGELLTRNMKPQGNKKLTEYFSEICRISKKYNVIFDGEIYAPILEFNELQTYIRTHDLDIPPRIELKYYMFDCIPAADWNKKGGLEYMDRLTALRTIVESENIPNVECLKQVVCKTQEQTETLFAKALACGFEGLILRNPNGLYKNGRCTVKQDNIFKLKEFETVDAKIVSFNSRSVMKEDAPRSRGETGELKRVNKKEYREESDDLGSITVETKDGIRVGIGLGKGTTQEYRLDLWQNRDKYIGKYLEFKYMPHGTKDLPRIGTFVRFRPDKD